MKEFIEKLIGRLEELKKREMDREENITEDGYWEDCDEAFEDGESNGRYQAVVKIMNIVNQLAEEYQREHDDTDYANIELYAFWQKHQWIPCSERLPEESDCYLVAWMDERNKPIPFYEIVEFDDRDWCGDISQAVGNYRILAWQPLPAPYQPKGEKHE